MARRFRELTQTPDVQAAQARYYARSQQHAPTSGPDRLGPDEEDFIASMDSFYLASVNQDGWPYVQHRGGPVGFLKVLSQTELGFADLKGNRQLLTTGNVAANDRVCLFLMSYPHRARLKLLGHAEIVHVQDDPALAQVLTPPGLESAVERLFRIRLEGFDWNCPQHITPRFTQADVERVVRPLQARVAELEAELVGVRARLGTEHG